MDAPAILKILSVFAAVLAVCRVRVPLGLALMAGGVGLDFWAGHDAARVGADVAYALKTPLLWFFMAIILMVVGIGRFFNEPRNAAVIAGAIGRWGGRHGRAGTLMAVPSFIGLIPSPAGALVSAPFVEQAAAHTQRSPEWKTAVNYVFRHTWEYWWPLYPAVIVGISVFGMESWRYMLALAPFTIVSVGAGYAILVRPHLDEISIGAAITEVSVRRFGFLITVMGVVVGGAVLLPSMIAAALPRTSAEDAKMLGMLAGLAAALVLIGWDKRRDSWATILRALFDRKAFGFSMTVAGVLIFKAMLDRSGLLPVAGRELVAARVPPTAVVMALPFLAGMVTGIGVGYTGTSYPLIVGLMHTPGSGMTPLATLALATAAGYVGMMLSPVHLCLLMTRDYFRASSAGIYRLLVLPMISVLACGAVLHALFRGLGW